MELGHEQLYIGEGKRRRLVEGWRWHDNPITKTVEGTLYSDGRAVGSIRESETGFWSLGQHDYFSRGAAMIALESALDIDPELKTAEKKNTKTRIVGIMGNGIGSGKTTVANYLVKEYGFTRVPLAKKLKEAVIALDPTLEDGVRLSRLLEKRNFEDVKRDSHELRRYLQRMGTEVGREQFGAYFWINLWLKEAEKHRKVVVDDVRFLNEAETIEDLEGGLLIVENPSLDINGAGQHASEEDWAIVKSRLGKSGVLLNDSSKESLFCKVDMYLQERDSLLDS